MKNHLRLLIFLLFICCIFFVTYISKHIIIGNLKYLDEKEYNASEENVKLIGRTYYLDGTLWMAQSAAGIEFTFTGKKADITFIGDNIAESSTERNNYCRVGIYVNGKLSNDILLNNRKKTITVFKSNMDKTVTIRVLKLSEALSSTLGIGKISIVSKKPLKPTQPNTHQIEFIGDSITCGYGIDGNGVKGVFSTSKEDVTKTYAYLTAQALHTDYSIVAFSGFGVISGHTSNGVRNQNQIIPPYYDKIGYSNGYFNRNIKVDSLKWNFRRFVPDLVIINLGTNDRSYCESSKNRQAEFIEGYIDFITQIRDKNPNATILCTLGMMGDNLYPCIVEAARRYNTESGDSKIFIMKFDVQKPRDGYGTHWHPSKNTNAKAAIKLTAEIKKIMGW